MLHIKDILKEEQISLDLKSKNKKEIIRELLEILEKNKLVADIKVALDDVLSRESYLSTGMENGLAIPHAKTDTVKDLVMAFGIHQQGIDFDSLDGKPARYIFLVLSPRDKSGPHIQALSIISRNIKTDSIRSALLKAKSAQEILNILEH